MPKIPEDIAAETVEECAKLMEAIADRAEMVHEALSAEVAQMFAQFLRLNRTTIIASVTKPEGK